VVPDHRALEAAPATKASAATSRRSESTPSATPPGPTWDLSAPAKGEEPGRCTPEPPGRSDTG